MNAVLAARPDEADRVLVVDDEADLRDLVLRVQALAKRSRGARLARTIRRKVLHWRGLEVEVARHRVTLDGAVLPLRPLEFKLLTTLLGSPGTIFSRADLMKLVWGTEEETDSRTADTHVRRLRERLGDYGQALETVHRVGYRWREEEGEVG